MLRCRLDVGMILVEWLCFLGLGIWGWVWVGLDGEFDDLRYLRW